MRYRAFADECRLKRVKLPSHGATVTFYMPMPKSWSKKKKALHNGTPHKQRPDLDNYIKAWCDSVFEEDSVVWRFKASKLWTDGIGHIKLSTL